MEEHQDVQRERGDYDARLEMRRDAVAVMERSERADSRKTFERHAARIGRLEALEQKVADLELRLSELSYRVAV